MSKADITRTASGRKPEELEPVAEPEPCVLLAELALERAPPDGDEAHRWRRGDHVRGGEEEIGIALGRAEVGHRTDQDLVVADAQAPAFRLTMRAFPAHLSRVDSVADDTGSGPDPGGQRVEDRLGDREVHFCRPALSPSASRVRGA